MPTALDLCPLSLAINSQLHILGWGEPVTIRQGRKEKKREITHPRLFRFFLVFLHESKILIFIKNNLKNTKNILTVRCNTIEFWTFDLINHLD
jgi:hypothetical protein